MIKMNKIHAQRRKNYNNFYLKKVKLLQLAVMCWYSRVHIEEAKPLFSLSHGVSRRPAITHTLYHHGNRKTDQAFE